MRRTTTLVGLYLPTLVKALVTIFIVSLVVSGLVLRGPGIPHRLAGSWRALALNLPRGTVVVATPAPFPSSPVAPSAGGGSTLAPAPASAPAPTPPTPAPLPPPLASQTIVSPSPNQPDLASRCQAALSYLASHAAPGFVSSCPHYADGHEAATTCVGAPQCMPGSMFIWIADPCPAAYMNEASNSWVLTGQSTAPWDPYGYCGEPGNPFG